MFGHKKRVAKDESDRETVSDWLASVGVGIDDREVADGRLVPSTSDPGEAIAAR